MNAPADRNPSPATPSPAVAGPAPLLELIDVAVGSLKTPTATPVRHVDWQIRAGETWIVGGLTQAGKTDLLATVAGLMRPQAGEQRFFGGSLDTLDEAELLQVRRRLGLVFSDGGRLFPSLSVEENIALPLGYHQNLALATVRDRLAPLLEVLELTPYAALSPSRIARGWRQRAALARALAPQPEVLLLDEPLAGLDRRQARWWLGFLAQLKAGHAWLAARPLTLVITTDDFHPWLNLGEQFAVLKQNRWWPIGTRADLAASREPMVSELLTPEPAA